MKSVEQTCRSILQPKYSCTASKTIAWMTPAWMKIGTINLNHWLGLWGKFLKIGLAVISKPPFRSWQIGAKHKMSAHNCFVGCHRPLRKEHSSCKEIRIMKVTLQWIISLIITTYLGSYHALDISFVCATWSKNNEIVAFDAVPPRSIDPCSV